MSTHSGRYASVNGVGTTRGWGVDERTQHRAVAASNTFGGMTRRRGITDWTGQVRAYGGNPAIMPGALFSFVGYIAPTNDTGGAAGTKMSGNAICEELSMDWDWEGGEPLAYQLGIAANGDLTPSSGVPTEDESFPDVREIISLGGPQVKLAGSGSGYSTLSDVARASLSIRAQNPTFVNSSTAGATGRRAGNIDFNLSVQLHNSDLLTIPFRKNDVVEFKLPTDDGEFWLIKWAICEGFSGVQVDRESTNIVGVSCNFGMCGFDHVNEEIGEITLPGGTPYWPFAH